ncbi:MAG: hypothetical protein RBU29_09210 [bacterium]|nr:hypothetical protein [bacterium]
MKQSVSFKGWAAIPVVLVIGVVATHLFAIQQIKTDLQVRFEKTALLASAEIQINPITNTVTIDRKNEVLDLNAAAGGVLKGLVGVLDTAEQEAVLEQVQATCRKYLDVYGMLVPYKVAVATQ